MIHEIHDWLPALSTDPVAAGGVTAGLLAPLRFLTSLNWAFSFWHQRNGWLRRTGSLVTAGWKTRRGRTAGEPPVIRRNRARADALVVT